MNTNLINTITVSWFQTFAVFWMSYAFFWVIASTTCFLYLLPQRLPPSEGLRLFFEPNLFTYNTPHSQPQSHFILTRLWRWDRQSVPKRWNLNCRRRGITQKKAYDTPTTSFRGAQAIFRAKLFPVQYPTFSTAVTLHTYSPMTIGQTECSETLAFKLQTPGNNPEESIRRNYCLS
jgi:hypothetical protein